MQNKPNFRRFCAKNADLEEKQTQNKANQSQNKPNSNPKRTQFYLPLAGLSAENVYALLNIISQETSNFDTILH